MSQSAGLNAATAASVPICLPVLSTLPDAGNSQFAAWAAASSLLYPAGGPFPSNDARPHSPLSLAPWTRVLLATIRDDGCSGQHTHKLDSAVPHCYPA